MDEHWPYPLTHPQNSRRKHDERLLSGIIGRTEALNEHKLGRNDQRREVRAEEEETLETPFWRHPKHDGKRTVHSTSYGRSAPTNQVYIDIKIKIYL